jgi:amino acid adenylation domain-containing protein
MRRFDAQRSAVFTQCTRDKSIHELLEAQAAATPDALAVLCENQELSYAQVNARANRLAHHLLRRGVPHGSLIGVCMQRSPELIVGLLGILKAGGAYVPLDPTYPDERLAFMLRDTATPLILAHGPTAHRLKTFLPNARVLCLDAEAAAISQESTANPTVGTTARDLAYVMYTSGSTGTPKGVLVGHRAVVRLVRDTDYCRFGPGEVFLHLAPLTFDASTFEIWGPLLNGSRLALLAPGPFSLDGLAAALRRYGVTTLWLTAGLFHLVVEQRVEILGHLRQLVAGGDVLSPAHVGRVLAKLDNGVLINGYGPTESTTFACCYRMAKGYRPGERVPIGRPIANTSVYVLDEQLQPVPAGMAGELHIGGDGLAHGYLNDPALTQAKFIADPFSDDPAARLYRTGDRVRYLTDGNLEFLGRFDDQVKIRGYRIEPGEIEAALHRLPEVRQAVVIARAQPHGEKQLVAYVVAANRHGLSAEQLKQCLAERLPLYMVPTEIAFVDHLPLNGNGKVDRSALPAPEALWAPESPEHTFSRSLLRALPCRAPHSPLALEEKLTALWSKILNRQVGREENFFDLGGTSLQWMEVHAELTKMLGQELSLTELFEHPTIRSLADWLTGKRSFDPSFTQAQRRAQRQHEVFACRKRVHKNGA